MVQETCGMSQRATLNFGVLIYPRRKKRRFMTNGLQMPMRKSSRQVRPLSWGLWSVCSDVSTQASRMRRKRRKTPVTLLKNTTVT